MRLALGDVIVDGPPVLPVLLKETGNLEDVRHRLCPEGQLGISADKEETEPMLTVPSSTAWAIVVWSPGQIC